MSRFHHHARRTLIFALAMATVWLATPRPTAFAEEEEEGAPPARHLAAPSGAASVHGTRIQATGHAVVNFADLSRQQAARMSAEEIIRGYKVAEEMTPVEEPLEPLSGFVPSQMQMPQAAQVASPGPINSYMGLDDIPMQDSLFIVIPPDVAGAVGPNKVMNTHNNNYRVLDKATGAVISTVGTATFWAPSGETALLSLTDPRTVYDPYNNCWISFMQTVTTNNGDMLVAVSQTSDPNGAWYLYRFAIGATLDFPILGFNKNWISINIHRFNTSGAFTQGINLVLDYGQARAGVGTGTLFTLPAGTGFCSAPCNTYSATEDTLFVVTHLSSGGATYTFDWITGTPSAPVYTVGGLAKTRPGGGWTQPSGNILVQSAPAAGTSTCGATPCKLESQDAQIRSAPHYRNGVIYYTQTIGLPAGVAAGSITHTVAQWTKLLATGATAAQNGTFLEGGRIEDPTATQTNGGKWYAYPHIAVNNVGDFIVGYSQFSSAQHPSAGYSYHDHSDAAGTIRDPVVYKPGDDYYHKTFTTATGRNRWGDFSQAQVDPTDDASLWTVQEYAKTRTGTNDGNTGSNSSKWSTYWAQTIGPQPTANIQPGPSLNEGNAGTTSFNFTVSLSSVYALPVTVSWQTQDGTATLADNDYLSTSGILTFPPGTSSQTVTVQVVGDTTPELNEDFRVQLTGATNAALGTSLSTGIIQNDDFYTITASAGANGSISPSGAVNVAPGADQTFTITAASCYHIADVMVDGASVGAVGTYTFPAVSANHTIDATFALNTYVITASAGPGGTIAPSGLVNVNCGDDQTFTISANSGFSIADVVADGVSVGAVGTYTFPAVAANHTISASFSQNTHVITATAGAGGSISPSGSITVNEHADQTFTITPDGCHVIGDVTVDGASVGSVGTYTFTDVTASHTIDVLFNPKEYTIEATAGAGGSINPAGNVSVTCGADQTFTITADATFSILDVMVDGVSVGAVGTYTFTGVTAAHTISASFSQNTHVITASAGAGGTISPNGSVTVNEGSNPTFTITPDNCHTIADVTVDGASVGAVGTYTFTNVTADHTINATFDVKVYTIATTAGAGGSISPGGTSTAMCGTSPSFTIAPDGCHSIQDVVVDGTSLGPVAIVQFTNIAANHTISATFSTDNYAISASAGPGGTISPSGTVTVPCGSDQTFTISPDACHDIADVMVDGVSVGAMGSYTFTAITGGHTIAASFTLKTYVINASAGPNGTINPSGAVSTNCGANRTFVITPNSGYEITDVLVDGVSVGSGNNYTFTNVTAAHTIAASFNRINHAPNLNVPVSQMVDEGHTLTYNVTGIDPDGDALTLSPLSIPAGSTFTDHHNNTGTFAWATTTSDGRATPYFSILRATDGGGLTGDGSTTLFVNDITPVRLFVKNSDKTIKLMSGNPDWCLYVETASFPLSDIVTSSVVLISAGTGSVSQIHILTGKSIPLGDADHNGTNDIRFCFTKPDLRLLFSSLTGKTTVTVAVEGLTLAGTKFRGTLNIDVQAGGGSSAVAAAISPNPLNPSTTLVYKLENPGPVRIRLYDVNGRLVRNIHESPLENAGYHQLNIEAQDGSGRPLSSGVYFYVVDVKGGSAKGSMVILK